MIHEAQIISLDALRPEEIAHAARRAYEHGQTVEECPYPAESAAAKKWRVAFIALERDADEFGGDLSRSVAA
jgi:hypothetical protein